MHDGPARSVDEAPPGLEDRQLGLNPRDIKYVVISHTHGDRDQGAADLQKRFGAKVVIWVRLAQP